MVTVSAPAKIHLMGEHAVVYGYPALLAAINLRMKVTIEEKTDGSAGIDIISSDDSSYARHALEVFLGTFQLANPIPARITITSDIPSGFHLGSSAAVAVCMSGALLFFYKKIWNPTRINELAYEIEKKQHGNPSGGDNTAVTMGGLIWYRKELEFLKSIWQLPFKPHSSLSHFVIANTGRPKESTGEMVSKVTVKMQNDKKSIEQQFRINELQTRLIAQAIKEGDEKLLLDALKTGEKTLEAIGVVSDVILPCIRDIEQSGGAAKILGGGGIAGGVGFLLCYHPNPEVLARIVSSYDWSIDAISLGEEGVRLEQH